MKVLSFGAGVQTITLAAMSCLGEMEMPNLTIFADTKWEKKATYEHLHAFSFWALGHGMKIFQVSKGNIRADALAATKRFASMPLWTETGFLVHRGKDKGMLRRQCTNEYKIEPVNKFIRQYSNLGRGQRWKGEPVELWLGISLDEFAARGKDSREKWIKNRYPLVERGMTRGDCVEWLKRHDLSVPPKSACVGCPFTDNPSWLRLKTESPEEFEAACRFDDAIRRAGPGVSQPVYLHPSLQPLRLANLNEAQSDFFVNECAGRCRV